MAYDLISLEPHLTLKVKGMIRLEPQETLLGQHNGTGTVNIAALAIFVRITH